MAGLLITTGIVIRLYVVQHVIMTFALFVYASVFVIVSVLLAWSAIVAAAHGPKTPKWPDCYSVKAVLRLPYAELEEPITAYYEGAKNRSRIDYYGWFLLSSFLCIITSLTSGFDLVMLISYMVILTLQDVIQYCPCYVRSVAKDTV